MNAAHWTLSDLRRALRAGALTPSDAVEQLLQRIREHDSKINGYLHLNEEAARRAAAQADPNLPLGGIPIAIKDNINVAGEPCTCASKILRGYQAPYDATVITLLKRAGAIPLGRTNLDEFAMGSSTENSSVTTTKNPWDLQRVPGGSSGGSAAVVAGDLAIAALGSDTGGSIRQPAAFCGCVGLKPTYGRVSRYGLVAFASSLDQIGPLTKTVEDAALLLQVLAAPDVMDNTSRPQPVPDYQAALHQDISGLKVGVPREFFTEGLEPCVKRAVREAIDWFRDQGAIVVDLSLPHTPYAVAVYYIIATAEASVNLARFDGVRYGYRAPSPRDILDLYLRTREEGFGPEVKRRIILGTYVLSSGYYDAYYNRAQKVRYLLRRDFEEAFKRCDILLTPTSPTTAFKIGEKNQHPLAMYLADVFTISVNLAGIPGLSLPCGFSPEGLPIGLQILGPHFQEARILAAGHAYEKAHPWVRRRPTTLGDGQ